MTIADINEQPRRPRPIITPFVKLDRIDKAAEIHRLTRRGLTVPEVAKACGVSDSAIYALAREEGIAVNSSQQTIWPKREEPPHVNVDPADPYTLPPGRLARHHWKRLTKAARMQRMAVGAAPPVPKPAEVTKPPVPQRIPVYRSLADRIVDEVSNKHLVHVSDLKSKRRDAVVVAARQEAYYRLRNETDMSLPQIGRKFGGFDHTTVLHGIRKHEERMGGAPTRKTQGVRREPVWGVGGWH